MSSFRHWPIEKCDSDAGLTVFSVSEVGAADLLTHTHTLEAVKGREKR